jgi:hypothetical protein
MPIWESTSKCKIIQGHAPVIITSSLLLSLSSQGSILVRSPPFLIRPRRPPPALAYPSLACSSPSRPSLVPIALKWKFSSFVGETRAAKPWSRLLPLATLAACGQAPWERQSNGSAGIRILMRTSTNHITVRYGQPPSPCTAWTTTAPKPPNPPIPNGQGVMAGLAWGGRGLPVIESSRCQNHPLTHHTHTPPQPLLPTVQYCTTVIDLL